jgi:Holliday junction resolvase RusA-like endonuclease
MTTIAFTVPGVPVAKGRPIVSTLRGRPMMRTPARTARYESQVALFASQAMAGRAPVTCAVIVHMVAVFPVAPSWPKRRQRAALAGEIRPTCRPDLDNVAKAVGDGCNGIAWADDSQIVELRTEKRYGEVPGLHVTVSWAGGESDVPPQGDPATVQLLDPEDVFA